MLFQVVIENGEKKLVPLTADAGAGNPVGTIIAFYGNTAPSGYLTCDGRQFDKNTYPVLYALLGDNHTPDLRECTLKMVGENPNGASHVKSGGLAIGEFIDDRIQNHEHNLGDNFYGGYPAAGTVLYVDHSGVNNDTKGVVGARTGATTEVKAVGVNFCIKATSGLSENAQDNVINTLNEQRSYSTEEHLTGRKWIDGKSTYEIVITGLTFGDTINTWTNCGYTFSNCDTFIKGTARRTTDNATLSEIGFRVTNNVLEYHTGIGFSNCNQVIAEYTKTV